MQNTKQTKRDAKRRNAESRDLYNSYTKASDSKWKERSNKNKNKYKLGQNK